MSDTEICGKEYVSKDGTCERAGDYPDGRCGYHTEFKKESDGDGNNYIHGVEQNRSAYYEDQKPEDQAWIDAIVDSFLENADFTRADTGKLTLLRNVAIDLHKKRRADEYIELEGMAQTQVEGFHESYGLMESESENVLHITADRLSRTSLRTLKELDVLSSPDSKQAEAQQSMVEALSKIDFDEDD